MAILIVHEQLMAKTSSGQSEMTLLAKIPFSLIRYACLASCARRQVPSSQPATTPRKGWSVAGWAGAGGR